MVNGAKRVPRGTLTRDRVVDAATELADEEGLAGLSMPKVAARLGVGVMSLYSHVASKDDLVDAVAQRLLGQLAAGRSPRPGLDGVRDHFRALRRLLVAHPGLGEVFATRGVTVPAVFVLLERNLTRLLEAGLEKEQAVRVYYGLLTYTLGFAEWQLPRTASDERQYRRRWDEVVDALPAEDYPTLHLLRRPLATVASDRQFEFGLQRLTELD
jgi:TetR/AcrR family transcriptional regulator, tetracycline repressor protein